MFYVHFTQLLLQMFGTIDFCTSTAPIRAHFCLIALSSSLWWKLQENKLYIASWNRIILTAGALTVTIYLFINPERLKCLQPPH